MSDEIDLVINSLSKIQDDLSYLRDKVDSQADKINDLCQRTTMTEEEVKKEIKGRVKNETSKYKFITIVFSSIGGIVSAITTIKQYVAVH